LLPPDRKPISARSDSTEARVGAASPDAVATASRAIASSPPPFAESILTRYADAARPPEEDLHDLARMLGNFALLVKGDDPLPLGANEEIAAALRGKNRAQLRALPDDHRAFNAQGQLVDRWGTPLYFHAESRDRLDVRSAGSDRKMWTADDLHRRHDGRFLRGDALLAPSLYAPPGTAR
jgi:hypothetical protein